MRALQVLQGVLRRPGQVLTGFQVALDQVDDDLGVRLGLEHRPFGKQLIAQLGVILHNAIMDEHHPASHAHVGVSVALVGLAVRRPARVPDADLPVDRRSFYQRCQPRELADIPANFDAPVF